MALSGKSKTKIHSKVLSGIDEPLKEFNLEYGDLFNSKIIEN